MAEQNNGRDNTRSKRKTTDDGNSRDQENGIPTSLEPIFRTILRLERAITRQTKAVNNLKELKDKQHIPKGLSIRIRPRIPTPLPLDQDIEWETILTTASNQLLDILISYWDNQLLITQNNNNQAHAKLEEKATPEQVEMVLKKVKEILTVEPQAKRANQTRGTDASEED